MVFDARRAPVTGRDASVTSPSSEDALSALYPLLVQFLTLDAYKNGDKRVPGSITLFSDQGVLKGCLNDKDADQAAFVSGSGLEALLESVEVGLREDRLDWRQAKKGNRRR